jgi:hypothetical protein
MHDGTGYCQYRSSSALDDGSKAKKVTLKVWA